MSSKLMLLTDPIEKTLESLSKNRNSAVIPIAWPELTARAPEQIWYLLKKARVVKNVNFKVGHAAMVIALDNEFLYFDFGRYITPLGYGRTRSAETDPKLILHTLPKWSTNKKLLNLEELCNELEDIKIATHGDGPMYASIHYEAEIQDLLLYVKEIIEKGYVRYKAFNKSDSNCARFVAKSLLSGWKTNNSFRSRFKAPVTVAPTPYFNVLAASSDGNFIKWENGVGEYHQKSHYHAAKDIFVKGLESFKSSKAKDLPTDVRQGLTDPPEKLPDNLSEEFVYLGGIGEAAWHKTEILNNNLVKLTRHYYSGDLEFEAVYEVSTEWVEKLSSSSCKLVHDTHFCWLTLQCKTSGEKHRFYRNLLQQ